MVRSGKGDLSQVKYLQEEVVLPDLTPYCSSTPDLMCHRPSEKELDLGF